MPGVNNYSRSYVTCAAAGLKRGDHVHMFGFPDVPGVVLRVDSHLEWADVEWGNAPASWSKRVANAELLLKDDDTMMPVSGRILTHLKGK
jgi:hypothetical protein